METSFAESFYVTSLPEPPVQSPILKRQDDSTTLQAFDNIVDFMAHSSSVYDALDNGFHEGDTATSPTATFGSSSASSPDVNDEDSRSKWTNVAFLAITN